MKKLLYFAISAATCLCLYSCGNNGGNEAANGGNTVVTEAPTVPDYETLGITPEELIGSFNKDPGLTKTFSKEYTVTDYEDGTSSFEVPNEVLGMYFSGTLETSTQEIIDITCKYKSSGDKTTDSFVASALMTYPVKYIFNVSDDDSMEFVVSTVAAGKEKEFHGATVKIGYNESNDVLMVIVKNN